MLSEKKTKARFPSFVEIGEVVMVIQKISHKMLIFGSRNFGAIYTQYSLIETADITDVIRNRHIFWSRRIKPRSGDGRNKDKFCY